MNHSLIRWLAVAVWTGLGLGTYLYLWGREWARRRRQYDAIRRRMAGGNGSRPWEQEYNKADALKAASRPRKG